jgi:precorrin-3B synthase
MRIGDSFCPGIAHAVPAKDGMLIRIRVPGGMISASELAAASEVSAAFANGQIEITSRANLQLRAISTGDLGHVSAALSAAGLFPSARHDRVRNIVTSPLAGFAPDDLIDSRPMIRELDAQLMADATLTGLHPKFSFGINGGGQWFSEEADDLSLRAFGTQDTPLFQLFLGNVDTGFAVENKCAVECLLTAAGACLTLADRFAVPVRARKLTAIPGALELVVEAVASLVTPSQPVRTLKVVTEAPLGVYSVGDLATIVPGIPLGHLTARQAKHLSDIALECGADLRLAPWHGVVLCAVPKTLVAEAVAQLESVELWCDGRDGFRGIDACAGSAGCDASLADVRAVATTLGRQLAGRDLRAGWRVHLAGCEKQCAMRHAATAELIATPSGYSMRIDGQLSDFIHSPESALQAILSRHAALGSEVSS